MRSTRARARTEDAKGLEVNAALVVTPFYYRISNNEILEHYRDLLETVDLPIIIYNVPKFTNFNLEPSIISRLASEYENLVGVKDSSGNINQITEIIRLVGERISILAGTADVILPSLMLGGKSAVIAVANLFPEICVDLYEEFRKGDFKKAGQLQKNISYLTHIFVTKYNQIAAIKAAMNYKALPGGFPRRPSLALEQKAQKEIEYILENM